MTVLIFANGELAETDWIRPHLAGATAIIAADGGARHVLAMGAWPSCVVGDMDSIADGDRAALAAAGVPFVAHPAAKDETDLELALLYAVDHYAVPIQIFGALGGRLDQMLANLFLLAHPGLNGRRVELLERHQRAWWLTGQAEIDGEEGDLLSLIPVGGDVFVAETSGLRWDLTGDRLAFGPARGISNVITSTPARIRLASGSLLCIHTPQGWVR